MKILSRSQYLHLTETPKEAFKSLKRRGQVPFFGPDRPDEDDSRRIYLGIEAVMLILVNDLSRDGGLDRDRSNLAVSVIAHEPELTIKGVKRAEAGEDIWIGIFEFYGDIGARIPLTSVGTRNELMSFIDNYEFEDGSKPVEHTFRIVLTSISRAVRQIHMLAPTIGVEITSLLLA